MREPAVPTRANGPPPAAMTAKRPRPRAALLAAAAVLVSGTAVVVASIFGGGSPAPTAAAGSIATAAKDVAARGTPTPAVTAAPGDRQRRAQAEAKEDELADELEVPARFSLDRKQRIAIARRYVAVGHRLLKRKKLGPARAELYIKALRTFPDYPRALAGVARVHLQRREGSDAVRWAKRLVAVQSQRGNNQLLLGDAWALRGDDTAARAAWRRAAKYGNATARSRLKKAASRAR